MKGKGKASHAAPVVQDCPLQFPDLNPVEHTRVCPRYTAVLGRAEEESVGIEELDTLQTELETLLACIAKRMRLLEAETQVLINWQDKGKDKKAGKVQPEPKRANKSTDERPSKKFKGESAGKASSSTPSGPGRPKSKIPQVVGGVKVEEFVFPESPKPPQVELPRLPKNETPNRFWATVEPYCAEIVPEDLKVLEDLMRCHDDNMDYHKTPNLGKHYSTKWAQEDLLEEQREGSDLLKPILKTNYSRTSVIRTPNGVSKTGGHNGSKMNDKKRGLNNSSNSNNSEANALLQRLEDSLAYFSDSDEASPFGPLTQRLVSALIEENIMTPIDDSSMTEADAAEAASLSPRALAKQLNIGNTVHLERRIKKELEEHGILEAEEKPEEDPDDEILTELRKKQAELRVLSQHNLLVTKRLYKMAKDEMQRQEIRKKMAGADSELMDAYRKIQTARQKKKTPTKKKKVPTATLR